MELIISLAIGIVFGSGIWLVLRPRSFQVLSGLMLMSYAVNLFIFSMGRLATGVPAVIGKSAEYGDPLPQALVLTAIVIGFAMTAFVVVLSLRSIGEVRTDHVDGQEPRK